MLYTYGRFIVRRARLLLVISGIVLIAATVFGAGAFGKLKNGGFDDPAAQSSQAQQIIDQQYGGQSNLVLLVTTRGGTVDDPAVAAAGRSLAGKLSAEPDMTGVISYWTVGAPGLRSTDGTQAIVLRHVTGGEDPLSKRSKEQLAAGDDVPEAVARTVATAGRTVIFSAGTVAAALAALLVFPQYFLRSFAYAGIGVVAIAALGANVMLPALLAVLGRRVNAGRV